MVDGPFVQESDSKPNAARNRLKYQTTGNRTFRQLSQLSDSSSQGQKTPTLPKPPKWIVNWSD
jgi:hypothetical protein